MNGQHVCWPGRKLSLLVAAFFLSARLLTLSASTVTDAHPAESPEDQLAAAIITAQNDEARGALIQAQPHLVNVRFRHALAMRSFRAQLQGGAERALASLAFARKLAEARGDKGWMAMTWVDSIVSHDLYGQNAKLREAYSKIPPLKELAHDPSAQAHVTILRGFLRWRQEQRDVTLADCQRALSLLAPEQKLERALAHSVIGMFHVHDTETEKASEYMTQGLREFEELGDRLWTAIPLTYLGEHFLYRGDSQTAFDYLRRGVAVSEEFGIKFLLHHNTKLLGDTYQQLNNWEQAEVMHKRCLAECEALGDQRKISFPLRNLANLSRVKGDYAKASGYLDRALKQAEQAQDHETASALWRYKTHIHFDQGKLELGLECSQKSLREALLTDIKEDIALALGSMGSALLYLGEYQKSLEVLQQALLSIEAGMETTQINILTTIGANYFRLNKFDDALNYNQQVLKVLEKAYRPQTHSGALLGIGDVYAARAEYSQALSFYVQAYQVAETHDPRSAAYYLTQVGKVQRLLKQEGEAQASFEKAIELAESWRARLASPDWRSSYFGWLRKSYESCIELLLDKHERQPDGGYALKAFHLSERGRARSLIDLLTEARTDIRADVEAALLARERELQLTLNAKSTRQLTLTEKKKLTPAQAADLAQEIVTLTNELDSTSAQIRATSRRYAALTRPQPLSAAEVQNQVLDAGTLLLEYELGEKSSWLFAVTPASLNGYRLPPRAEIEAAVTRLRELMVTPQRTALAEADYWRQAQTLSQMILGPAAAELGQKRLAIVASGALQYLPFAALPEPATGEQPNGHGLPLIVNHEIINLPSASTLAVLRRELTGREPAPKAVAVLADPVFSDDDPRVKRSATRSSAARNKTKTASRPDNSAPKPPDKLALSLRGFTPVGRASLSRLLFSRDEAEAIMAAAPVGLGLKSLDFNASRPTVTNSGLGQYRIVHFATHGLLNAEHPELSGLVLSLVDEKGQPQDGFLRLHEIYNLKLNADLVVLSACQTALGKDIKGEGLIGLTRGFMYAGAPRVVASLWKVEDVATSELMKRFYRAMLQQKQRPAAALRAAQLEMMQRKRWQSPFYWAAFTLQGEWK